MNYTDTVQSMYIAYYGRPGDPQGVEYWADRLAAVKGNLDAILDAFGNSTEYTTRFGSLSTSDLVNRFYQQIFNREADESGLNWYCSEYEAGRASLVNIAKKIWDGAQGSDLIKIQNKLNVAENFTDSVKISEKTYGSADIDRAVSLLKNVDTTQASVASALELIADWYAQNVQEPTDYEQLMLEIINWERMYPVEAASYYGIAVNEGLAAGTLHNAPRQPLAMNLDILTAAREHSRWMLEHDTFSHAGADGSKPWHRMEAAGYDKYTIAGENIAWFGTTGTYPASRIQGDTKDLERALFVDEDIPDRGHRLNILNDAFKEVGIGIEFGQFGQYNAIMATQDFGARKGDSFLLGVLYEDRNKNNFYDMGEGIGQASITATNTDTGQPFTTTSFSSGGYQIQIPDGHYLVAVMGDTAASAEIAMTGINVKCDWIQDM
ncbi:hypothetical protein MASR1M90_20840 [Desulfovibrionales bacterium]